MTIVDPDRMTPQDLILHFVLECRGAGHFLPYQDHQILEEWMTAAFDVDELLLVLSDVLPEYYKGPKAPDKPRSLKGAQRLVLKRLAERAADRPRRASPGCGNDTDV